MLAPAKSIAEMQRVAFNNYLDAVVCAFFVLLVLAMCVFAVKICLQALKQANPTAHEIPPHARGGRSDGVSMQRAATPTVTSGAQAAVAAAAEGELRRACAASARHAGRSSACRTTSATSRTLPSAHPGAPVLTRGEFCAQRDRAQVRAGRRALLLSRRQPRKRRDRGVVARVRARARERSATARYPRRRRADSPEPR